MYVYLKVIVSAFTLYKRTYIYKYKRVCVCLHTSHECASLGTHLRLTKLVRHGVTPNKRIHAHINMCILYHIFVCVYICNRKNKRACIQRHTHTTTLFWPNFREVTKVIEYFSQLLIYRNVVFPAHT